MKVVVTGDFREPVLLNTNKASGLLIYSDSGQPNVVYRFIGEGKGWIRYTKGEDPAFEEVVKNMGLLDIDK